MKRAGIITFHRAINYGAVLQGYALQQALKKLNIEAEFIDYNCQVYDHYKINMPNNKLKRIVKKILLYHIYKKKKKFTHFIKNYCKLSKQEYTRETIMQIDRVEQYDLYITGSDQVWSPDIVGDDHTFFLDFAPKEKSISYAASIGIDRVPDKYIECYKENIGRLRVISVREKVAYFELQKIGITKVFRVCDPVFLLERREWEKIEKKIKTPVKYVLVFDFCADPMLWDAARNYAKKMNITICYIDDSIIPSSKAKKISGIGPREWIYLIHHAECVFTNSFHALAFSIIFERDFWTARPNDNTNSRLHELLEVLHLEEREMQLSKKMSVMKSIDYSCKNIEYFNYICNSNKFLESIINSAEADLEDVFNIEKKKEINYVSVCEECTGCTACAASCPQNAIEMVENALGSLYPYVNLKVCINCGICTNVCSIGKNVSPSGFFKTYYAARTKNREILDKSGSGGIFWSVAKIILKSHGIVYGVEFDEKKNVVYGRAENVSELEKIRGTKYVESNKNGIFIKVKRDLEDNKKVLFTGTPCTIDGLIRFLPDKLKKELFTMDIICHGTPVPLIYNDYRKFMERKFKSKVKYLNFREKKFDENQKEYLHTQRIWIEFENGKSYEGLQERDPFYNFFWSNNVLRDSCFTCRYTCMDRTADITIGDYWGNTRIAPDFFKTKTESCCLINSPKGRELFNAIKNDIDYLEVKKEDIMQRNLQMPTPKNSKKNLFWNDYFTKSFKFILVRYVDYWRIFKIFGKLVK
ncbi:polysaccharide pyruvyl transferase family protein [Lachnospiraceae bacterium 29-84]